MDILVRRQIKISVEKSSRISDIWNLWYNRLSTDVTSVTLNDSSISTVQRYSASFSQESFNSTDNFPMMIIESPTFDDESETMTREKTTGEIFVEMYTTSAQSADKFSDAILDSIETYKKTLADNGLKQVHGSIVDKDEDPKGSIFVHVRRIKFTYEYRYTKSKSY